MKMGERLISPVAAAWWLPSPPLGWINPACQVSRIPGTFGVRHAFRISGRFCRSRLLSILLDVLLF